MKRALFVILAAGLIPAVARAHDPGLSSANVTLRADAVDALVTFNQRDVDALALKGAALAERMLVVRVGDEVLRLESHHAETDAANNVTFTLRYQLTALNGAEVHISSGLMDELPFGHREMVSIKSSAGQTLAERLLSQRENDISTHVAATQPSPPAHSAFLDFFRLGVRHILTGYDHLLFLAALLIACANFRAAARLITCFTVAHSVSLALATFNIVSLSGRIVEPMIAASIVYVAVENIVAKRGLHWREVITFAFGLIHGLGFATALRELGIGNTAAGVVVPLVSFNLGVETGQLAVAAVILPLILRLKSSAILPPLAMPAVSCVIACAGAYWFVERIVT